MEIQNDTDEKTVYEAKDGGPGGGQDPLTVLCGDALQVRNAKGSAGRLDPGEKVNISAGVDSFSTVQLRVFRPADQENPVANEPSLTPVGRTYRIVKPQPNQFEIEPV